MTPTGSTVYIGIGANLNDPQQQVKDAIEELGLLPQTKLLKASSLYHSKPVGPQDQPDYINAVASIRTELEPLALLDALQALEQQHGRVRKRHWGERTLDLDILLIDQQIIESERLIVPHPYAAERSFVLFPLEEIAPELIFPNGKPLQQLCEQITNDVVRIK